MHVADIIILSYYSAFSLLIILAIYIMVDYLKDRRILRDTEQQLLSLSQKDTP